MPETAASSSKRRVPDFFHVLATLETLCASLSPGDRVPTHTVLMAQFGASERTVLRALEELRRTGLVVRRNGIGTFVAERAGHSHTVVAIAEPRRFFDDRGVAELCRCAEDAGISLVYRAVAADAERAHLPLPGGHPSHGYLVFGNSLEPVAKRLQDVGCRVVMIGAQPHEVAEVPCVYGDHEQGGYLALQHLVELGHRRVAFWGGPHGEHATRGPGYQRALLEAGRGQQSITTSVLSPETVAGWKKCPERIAAFFRTPEAPTGILAWSDREALTLLSLLARAGVRVPDEVSLVGYEALVEGERVYPALTTVDHGWCQQLQAAFRLLTGATPPPRSHTTVLVPSLVLRESTCRPPR